MQDINRDDPEALLFAEDINGSFLLTPEGYETLVPSDLTIKVFESLYKSELDTAWNDSVPDREFKLRLLRAVEGTPEARSKKPPIAIPIVKRVVNQVVAWTKNTIMQRRPLVTVEPDCKQDFTILIPGVNGSMPELVVKTAEEEAEKIEAWLEFKLRKKVDFDQFVEVAVLDCQQGQTPTWGKTVYNPKHRTIKTYKKQSRGGQQFISKQEDQVLAGESVRMLNVSTYNMLMPADEQNEQEARWIAENCRMTSAELRRLFYSGQCNLVKPDEYETLIRSGLTNPQERTASQTIAALDRRVASQPISTHDIWEIWFRRWLRVKDEDSGTVVTKEFEFCGLFHKDLGRFLYIYKNPYDHGKRPYKAIFQKKKPHRHSGGSTAEDTLPFQDAMSKMLSLEIRNAIRATTQVTYARPGSASAEWLNDNAIEPGSVIPRDSKDDVETVPFGSDMHTLLNLMDFCNKEVEKMVQQGDLQLGLEIPGRTPVGTVQQVMNSGATQAAMFLDSFRRDIGEVVQMYVQTCQQYSREAEPIPFQDPESKEMVELFLHFPLEAIHDQFSFSITASSDDQTNQAKFQQAMMMVNVLDSDNLAAAQIFGPMINAGMSDAALGVMKQFFNRKERLLKRLFGLIQLDGDSYTVSPKMLNEAIALQKQTAIEAAQQAQMQEQPGGGPTSVPSPFNTPPGPAGPVPPGPNQGGGLAAPLGQPGPPGMPPGGPPIPPAPLGLGQLGRPPGGP